jgi:hypothetical protein
MRSGATRRTAARAGNPFLRPKGGPRDRTTHHRHHRHRRRGGRRRDRPPHPRRQRRWRWGQRRRHRRRGGPALLDHHQEALNDAGRAESFDGPDKRTRWRLTTAGQAGPVGAAAQGQQADPAAQPAAHARPARDAGPAVDGDPDTAAPRTSTDADQPGRSVGPDAAPADPPGHASTGDADAPDAQPGHPQPATGPATPAQPPAGHGDHAPAQTRRAGGSLRGAILDILQANPDRQYKVGELCTLIDAANAGTGAAKASQGAVYNAAVKLVNAQQAAQTVERPATFQLATPPTGTD